MNFKNLVYSRKSVFWVPVIVILKAIILFIFLALSKQFTPELVDGISIQSNDYSQLVDPVNNLVESGSYRLRSSSEPYAGRLPGYSFPYIFYRYLFAKSVAHQLLILSQIFLSAFAIFLFAKLVEEVSSKKMFYWTVILFSFFAYFIKDDLWTLSASFSASTFMIHLYYTYKFIKYENNKDIFLSGLWMTWLFLLRPFTLLYFIVILLVLFAVYRNKIIYFLKIITLFLLPLLLFESFWIPRNYVNTGKIIPLQVAYVPGQNFKYVAGCGVDCVGKYSVVEVRKLVSAWGGNSLWFVPGTELHWFLRERANYDFSGYTFQNQSIFTKEFTIDSLLHLKRDLVASYDESLSFEERFSLDEIVVEKSRRYTKSYAASYPFNFYVVSHIKRLKIFLGVNVTADWPGPAFKEGPWFYSFYKLISLVFHLVLIFVVFVFPYLMIFNRSLRTKYSFIVAGYVYSLLFVFSFLVELAGITYYITGFVGAYLLFLMLIGEWENWNVFPKKKRGEQNESITLN